MTPRSPRLHDSGFLSFLRVQPCCICGATSMVEAAHIRMGLTGMQRKPDDCKAVPLCAWHHRNSPCSQHSMSEERFWKRHGMDPFKIAARLYDRYGGAGGKARGPRKIKPRKSREQRAKIKGRSSFR